MNLFDELKRKEEQIEDERYFVKRLQQVHDISHFAVSEYEKDNDIKYRNKEAKFCARIAHILTNEKDTLKADRVKAKEFRERIKEKEVKSV